MINNLPHCQIQNPIFGGKSSNDIQIFKSSKDDIQCAVGYSLKKSSKKENIAQ